MTVEQPDRSKRGEVSYFEDRRAHDAFDKSFGAEAQERMKRHRSNFMSPQNVQHFHHNGSWKSPANPDATKADMQKHSVELTAHFADLIGGDLNQIEQALRIVVKGMSRQFENMLMTTVSEAAEASGNTVSMKSLGIPEAFIAALEKIEFSADKDENITMPTLMPTTPNFLEVLQAQPPEFEARVEAIKEKKKKAAIECERKRKAKFVRYGE